MLLKVLWYRPMQKPNSRWTGQVLYHVPDSRTLARVLSHMKLSCNLIPCCCAVCFNFFVPFGAPVYQVHYFRQGLPQKFLRICRLSCGFYTFRASLPLVITKTTCWRLKIMTFFLISLTQASSYALYLVLDAEFSNKAVLLISWRKVTSVFTRFVGVVHYLTFRNNRSFPKHDLYPFYVRGWTFCVCVFGLL